MEKFAGLILESKDMFVEEAKHKFEEYKRKEHLIRVSLSSLQRLQERTPNCEWLQNCISQARKDLFFTEQKKADFLYYNSQSKWINVGDKVTKEFFQCTKQKYTKSHIRALKDINGQLCMDAKEIRNIATTYYANLL